MTPDEYRKLGRKKRAEVKAAYIAEGNICRQCGAKFAFPRRKMYCEKCKKERDRLSDNNYSRRLRAKAREADLIAAEPATGAGDWDDL